LTGATRHILAAAKNLGRGDSDYSTLVDLVASWAGVAVRG
jgi:hypothetical protein